MKATQSGQVGVDGAQKFERFSVGRRNRHGLRRPRCCGRIKSASAHLAIEEIAQGFVLLDSLMLISAPAAPDAV